MLKKVMAGVLIPAFAFCMVGCDIDKTEEGRLPDVDVDVEGGKLPKYDVETADVEIGSKKAEITLPDVDVDVDTKKHEITVPDIDVTMPDEKLEPGEVNPD